MRSLYDFFFWIKYLLQHKIYKVGGAMYKKIGKSLVILGLFFCLILVTNVNYREIYSLPDNLLTNYSELKEINQNKKFGSIINE